MDVIATSRGYYGRQLREEGDRFALTKEDWEDKKKRPSWVRQATAKDHDENAEPGADVLATGVVTVPDGWEKLTAAERKALAKSISGDNAPTAKEADATISAYLAEHGTEKNFEPFDDAPEPVRVKNEINDQTGGTQPDWVAPGGKGKPKPVAD